MIEVLQSLPYKANKDLTTIGVTANGSTLPAYSQTVVGGQYVYTKSFTPKYLEGAINYGVSSQDVRQKQIRDYVNLGVGYDPIDTRVNYLSAIIYSELPSLEIPYFQYWYDVATIYSVKTIQQEVSTKDLYRTFGDSVGHIMLYTPTPETTYATALNATNVKPYNRTLASKIPDAIRDVIDDAYKDANSSYSENLANIASNASPTTAHGARLVVDVETNTRYPSTSSTYVSNLFATYAQLLYLSPLYANVTQSVALNAPYFNAAIGSANVIVDKLGNKVNTDYGWFEQVMLSAYDVE